MRCATKLRALHHRLAQLKGKDSLVDGYVDFSLNAFLANILASSAIKSEVLDIYAVRSSLAHQPLILKALSRCQINLMVLPV
jgi:hypothetical protein